MEGKYLYGDRMRHTGMPTILETLEKPLSMEFERPEFIDFYTGRKANEKAYQDLLHEIRNSLTEVVMTLSSIEVNWQRMTLNDFMRMIGQAKDTAIFIGDLMKRHDPAQSEFDGVAHPEELDVTTVVAEVVKRYADRAERKHIRLTFHPLVLSTIILADGFALRQAIENLLSDAIKFSPLYSAVDVYVSLSSFSLSVGCCQFEIPQEESEAIRFVRVEVHDSGPWITAEDKRHLLERGARLSAYPTGSEAPSRLGLSIVKKLIESMGGQIWCESNSEQDVGGSRFIIEFPLFRQL